MSLLGGLILLTIGIVLHPASSFTNLHPLFKPEVGAFSSIIAIVAIAPWAYIGFDNIPQAAEEFNFSPKKSFKLIVLALLCAGFAYRSEERRVGKECRFGGVPGYGMYIASRKQVSL